MQRLIDIASCQVTFISWHYQPLLHFCSSVGKVNIEHNLNRARVSESEFTITNHDHRKTKNSFFRTVRLETSLFITFTLQSFIISGALHLFIFIFILFFYVLCDCVLFLFMTGRWFCFISLLGSFKSDQVR